MEQHPPRCPARHPSPAPSHGHPSEELGGNHLKGVGAHSLQRNVIFFRINRFLAIKISMAEAAVIEIYYFTPRPRRGCHAVEFNPPRCIASGLRPRAHGEQRAQSVSGEIKAALDRRCIRRPDTSTLTDQVPLPSKLHAWGLDQQVLTGGFGEGKSIVADADNQMPRVPGTPKEALSQAALQNIQPSTFKQPPSIILICRVSKPPLSNEYLSEPKVHIWLRRARPGAS